ncbi:MAG: hypothetical protein WC955_11715 [Elusimicrobiota bacterium]
MMSIRMLVIMGFTLLLTILTWQNGSMGNAEVFIFAWKFAIPITALMLLSFFFGIVVTILELQLQVKKYKTLLKEKDSTIEELKKPAQQVQP